MGLRLHSTVRLHDTAFRQKQQGTTTQAHVALDHTTQGNFLDDPISKINALIPSVPV